MITDYCRKFAYGLAALLLSAAAAYGQGLGGAQVSLGYSYLRANTPPGQCGCFGLNAGSGALALGLGHGLSAVADFGGYTQGNVVSSGRSLTLETFLFGPRYALGRAKKVTPFVQFLAGGAHGSGTLYGTATTSGSANGFSFSTGGGLDWNATRHVSVRLFQAEYLMTRLPNAVNGNQDNLRLTFGMAFRFGRK
jgi:hypothetical protein